MHSSKEGAIVNRGIPSEKEIFITIVTN